MADYETAGDGQTYDSFGNVVASGSDAAASADPTGVAQSYLDWLTTDGSNASSNYMKSISDLLSGKGAGGTAGQLMALGGVGSLLNSIMGGGGGYSGYRGSIPTYTAQRTMNAIPQTVAAPTAANPQATMPRRPGSGGITYFTPMQYLTPAQVAAQTAPAAPAEPVVKVAGGGLMNGGIASLGGYSDGGRLLRGPGDGVSDSIPATIGGKQPARLADGEFVVPARIVSELGNGSTEAGARKLYEMMDRIKASRKKAKNIAADTKAAKHLPA